MDHNSTELPLLDILIKNLNGKIITDIYHKPTDTQQYLHFKSHYPENSINSTPYTLTRRIHTIITDKKKSPKRTTHNSTPEMIRNNTIKYVIRINRKNSTKRITESEKAYQREIPRIRRNLQQKKTQNYSQE